MVSLYIRQIDTAQAVDKESSLKNIQVCEKNMQISEFEKIACPVCGKVKLTSTYKRDWLYKTQDHGRIIYFCSYTCYRKWLKKYKQPPKKDDQYGL